MLIIVLYNIPIKLLRRNITMTRIDMENNIVEFEHKKALDDAFLLLSYVHQMPQFKQESPSEFLAKWAEYYQEFLEEKNPSKVFEKQFKKIREENKKRLMAI